jgi:predicted O-linked N-acetylglucosamine transferase (SPINDLY family)
MEAAPIDALLAQDIDRIEARDLPEAIARLRALTENEAPRAANMLALARAYCRAGDMARAIQAFERCIALDPDCFEAYRSAADAALAEAQKAAAAGAKASRDLVAFAAMYLLALGKRQRHRHHDGAEATLREATALDPKCAEAFWALGDVLQTAGHSGEAEKPLRRAIALDPRQAHFYVSLGRTLQSRLRFDAMNAAYRKALALKPSLRNVRDAIESIPLCNLLYDDRISADTVFERHAAWGAAVAAENPGAPPPFANTREPERRLRIAYLSPDFRYHAVSFFFQPLLAHHDAAAFDVFCYAELDDPDPVTAYLQSLGGTWRNTATLDDATLSRQLRADRIDIAVDLAGHTTGNRLRALALKPAPVLATWLGYPATTGLAAIDWRITDARADPSGQERVHTEQLMRLAESFLCFAPFITQVPEVAPVPAARLGRVTFGSFNNPLKISAAAAASWARILAAVPNSHLVLKSVDFNEPVRRQALLALFAAHGIEAERIELRPPQPAMPDHLGSYADIDIALDPFPYNGTTTTCEAMWMGVPVVAVIGDHHAARVGFDLLSRVGLEDLAAPNPDAYVATAIALARDVPRLETLRGELRERMRRSPLCDGPRFARSFEDGLRRMWRHWCSA